MHDSVEGLNKYEDTIDSNEVFEESLESQKAEEKLEEMVASLEQEILESLPEIYAENTYHNKEHTKDVIESDVRNIEIASQFDGLIDNPAVARITARLAAVGHDAIHYRRKAEENLGEVSPEDDSKAFVRGWFEHNKETAVQALYDGAAEGGYDPVEAQKEFSRLFSIMLENVSDKIDATKAKFGGMVEVSDEQFNIMCGEVERGCREGDVEEFREHFRKAPPAGEVRVLLIEQPNVTEDSSFEMVSTAFADLKQGGKVPAEQFFKSGDGEFWEINGKLKQVLENAESQSPEALAETTNTLLKWLDGQPGFLFAQWADFENKLSTNKAIEGHPEADSIREALRSEYSMFRENVVQCINRSVEARSWFGESSKNELGDITDEAFSGEQREVAIVALKHLYEEMKVETAAERNNSSL